MYAGLIFLILALFFTSPQVLSIIAVGVLGALLVFVGIEMGRHSLKTDSLVITGIIGILALVISITLAFIVGMIAAYGYGWIKTRRGPARVKSAIMIIHPVQEFVPSGHAQGPYLPTRTGLMPVWPVVYPPVFPRMARYAGVRTRAISELMRVSASISRRIASS